MSVLRVCRERGCTTVLSRYNHEPTCWEHTPSRILRRERPDSCVPKHMTERFRHGLPGTYDISATEHESYRSGSWIA